ESVFRFFIDGEKMHQGIVAYLRTGKGGGVGETTRHRLATVDGREVEVEVALSVSQAGESRMFTAILRNLA
ncbi:MAG TPA: histidine kinase, partial [Geobacteraceae bacterium]